MTTRDAILDAAADVMRTRGLARATTKEIARASGFSEATLYKNFQDKEDLFLAVLHERVRSFAPLQAALLISPGTNTVRDNLVEVVRAAAVFYAEGFPMTASIFSEPSLLAAHRTAAARRSAGPQKPIEALAAYVQGEQQLRRITAEADASAVAAMLLGACLNYGFLNAFYGRAAYRPDIDRLASSTVDTLLNGLASTSNNSISS